MAGLDSTAGLPALALLCLAGAMESQFHTPVWFVALGPMAKIRTAQSFTKLWDSHRRRTLPGTTRASVFGWIWLKAMGQPMAITSNEELKFSKRFSDFFLVSLGNPRKNAAKSAPISQH